MKRIKPEHARVLQSPESSGVQEAETQPAPTSTPDASPETATSGTGSLVIYPPSGVTTPETSVSEPEAPVMQRLRQKAKEEAENGTGATKGPHRYEYSVAALSAVPDAFRDENYNVDHGKIDASLQDAWDHDRNPQISGLMIGRKV